MALIDELKLTLRIRTNAFNDELNGLIESAKTDLTIAGVVLPTTLDDVCKRAIFTYCKMYFGTPKDYEHLKTSYDEQKAQLVSATGYTDWLNG